MAYDITGGWVQESISAQEKEKYVEVTEEGSIQEGVPFTVFKYASNISSMHVDKGELTSVCQKEVLKAQQSGYEELLQEHVNLWAQKWEKSDITIDGDVSAQQGIRFNIFQLNQTYTGEDARLNIGPKGFTGEKYGGSTYWDTEAYCLAFYLATSDQQVAKNLLLYRYKHLQKPLRMHKN